MLDQSCQSGGGDCQQWPTVHDPMGTSVRCANCNYDCAQSDSAQTTVANWNKLMLPRCIIIASDCPPIGQLFTTHWRPKCPCHRENVRVTRTNVLHQNCLQLDASWIIRQNHRNTTTENVLLKANPRTGRRTSRASCHCLGTSIPYRSAWHQGEHKEYYRAVLVD